MIPVFLADGFEEIEALTAVDVLRRAGLDAVTVGVGGRQVRGAHDIVVTADRAEHEVPDEDMEALVLPGGMPGTKNLEASPVVGRFLDAAVRRGLWICAICAAPSILGHRGLLDGRRATCFPGFEKELEGARITGEAVTVDRPFITGKGAGTAMAFALRIVAELKSPEEAAALSEALQVPLHGSAPLRGSGA